MAITADTAKQAAIEKVLSYYDKWSDKALVIVANVTGFEGIAEELREIVIGELGQPPHPNVWGAVIAQSIKLKNLILTGEYQATTDPKSHARKTQVIRSKK